MCVLWQFILSILISKTTCCLFRLTCFKLRWKFHYVNCIITRWIRSTSAALKISIETSKRNQYKIYWKAVAKFCHLYFLVMRWLHPSKIYLSQRLGEDCSQCRGRSCVISLPLSLLFTFRHFRAGSPNTDRRLFQSALTRGEGWCTFLMHPLILYHSSTAV